MRRTIFTSRARRDLAEAWDYIADENLIAANNFLHRVEKAVELLEQMPGIGHSRPDAPSQYRFWTVKPYLLAYRFTSKSLTILRVIHGARDFRKIF